MECKCHGMELDWCGSGFYFTVGYRSLDKDIELSVCHMIIVQVSLDAHVVTVESIRRYLAAPEEGSIASVSVPVQVATKFHFLI